MTSGPGVCVLGPTLGTDRRETGVGAQTTSRPCNEDTTGGKDGPGVPDRVVSGSPVSSLSSTGDVSCPGPEPPATGPAQQPCLGTPVSRPRRPSRPRPSPYAWGVSHGRPFRSTSCVRGSRLPRGCRQLGARRTVCVRSQSSTPPGPGPDVPCARVPRTPPPPGPLISTRTWTL